MGRLSIKAESSDAKKQIDSGSKESEYYSAKNSSIEKEVIVKDKVLANRGEEVDEIVKSTSLDDLVN